MNKISVCIKRIIFIALTIVLLVWASEVLERKTIEGVSNHHVKIGGFKNEPQNSFDIIGYGSSHMYCTMNPISIYNETGVRSYVLATQTQPVEATYYYMKESLKTQTPEVLVVEAFMFITTNDYVLEDVAHDAIEPFPAGINKLKMIHSLQTYDSKENYYFPFMKYHTRWKELSKTDFDFSWKQETDPTHGYVLCSGTFENNIQQISYDNVDPEPITKKHEEVFLDMVLLAEEHDCEILLFVAPYAVSPETLGYYKYLHNLAEANGVKVLDMNEKYNDTGIDDKRHFYDEAGHLNVEGSEIASTYLMQFIESNYEIVPNDVDDAELWDADISFYNDCL